jgi:hypothetical protein
MESLLPIHTSVGPDSVVEVEPLTPIGEPAIVVAFDAHTVLETFEVEISAKIKQKYSKRSFVLENKLRKMQIKAIATR